MDINKVKPVKDSFELVKDEVSNEQDRKQEKATSRGCLKMLDYMVF